MAAVRDEIHIRELIKYTSTRRMMGARLDFREGIINMIREKIRVNSVAVGGSWRYQYRFMNCSEHRPAETRIDTSVVQSRLAVVADRPGAAARQGR